MIYFGSVPNWNLFPRDSSVDVSWDHMHICASPLHKIACVRARALATLTTAPRNTRQEVCQKMGQPSGQPIGARCYTQPTISTVSVSSVNGSIIARLVDYVWPQKGHRVWEQVHQAHYCSNRCKCAGVLFCFALLCEIVLLILNGKMCLETKFEILGVVENCDHHVNGVDEARSIKWCSLEGANILIKINQR